MANSLERAAARARRRFERLTQTMRRMSPTAPQRMMSERRRLPETKSLRSQRCAV